VITNCNTQRHNKTTPTYHSDNTHTTNCQVSPYNTFWYRRRVESYSGNTLKSQVGEHSQINCNQSRNAVLHQKLSYIKFRILLVCWLFFAH